MAMGEFFFQQSYRQEIRDSGVSEATLSDADLIRGNDPDESVVSGELQLFQGFTVFRDGGQEFEDGEVSTTVTFTDGTSLSGVLGLTDRVYVSFVTSNLFLLDLDALALVGKSLTDVASVRNDAFVDHDLSWADFGFGDGAEPPAPDPTPDPEPEPEPELNVILGTEGRDRLVGTDGADALIGLEGNDRLTGGAGPDTFVFGDDAQDGTRSRDVITDFAADDTIVLESGASILRATESNGDVYVRLTGDRDVIIVRDADLTVLDNVVTIDDAFGF